MDNKLNNFMITNLFGTDLIHTRNNDNLPFILLRSNYPDLVLYKISENVDGIWKPRMEAIRHMLQAYNINPNNFGTLGDIWFPYTNSPDKITLLLVNKNESVSVSPIDFIKIDIYAGYTGYTVWKPVASQDYLELGLIVSSAKPNKNEVQIVNTKFLIEYEGPSISVGRNTNMNEFNLLSNIAHKKYTINKKTVANIYKPNKVVTENKSNELVNDAASDVVTWVTHEGKTVILSEPDTPWYVLKNEAYSHKIKDNTNTPHQPYFMQDMTSGNTDDQYIKIEEFTSDNKFNTLICSLLLLILILTFIRYSFYTKSV